MMMRLVALLEHARADLLEAIGAIQAGDAEKARAQLEAVRDHFAAAEEELRAA